MAFALRSVGSCEKALLRLAAKRLSQRNVEQADSRSIDIAKQRRGGGGSGAALTFLEDNDGRSLASERHAGRDMRETNRLGNQKVLL